MTAAVTMAVALVVVGVVTRDRQPAPSSVLDATDRSAAAARTVPCPDSVPRRGIDPRVPEADALPYIDDAAVDSAGAERVLASSENRLRRQYPGMRRAELGPGFGRAWRGENGGAYEVIDVEDVAVVVHLASVADCPTGGAQHTSIDGIPVFFVVDEGRHALELGAGPSLWPRPEAGAIDRSSAVAVAAGFVGTLTGRSPVNMAITESSGPDSPSWVDATLDGGTVIPIFVSPDGPDVWTVRQTRDHLTIKANPARVTFAPPPAATSGTLYTRTRDGSTTWHDLDSGTVRSGEVPLSEADPQQVSVAVIVFRSNERVEGVAAGGFGIAPGSATPVDWKEIGESPLSARYNAISVWADDRFLVVGGMVRTGQDQEAPSTEGATYDPATDRWQSLPEAPFPLTSDAAVAWTGADLLVWSGSSTGNQGAAFTPATGRWRPIAPSPLHARWSAFTTWTGTEILVWGGAASLDTAPDAVVIGDGAAYNPSTNAWRPLPTSPRPRGAGGVSVWTGTTWILGGGENGTDGGTDYGFVEYDPRTNTWTRLPDPPLEREIRTGAWLDGGLYLWSGDLGPGVVWHPDRGWQETSAPPTALVGGESHPTIVVLDHRLLFLNSNASQWRIGTYDILSDTWSSIAPPAAPPRLFPSASAAPEAVIIFGGFDGTGPRRDALLLRPRSS